MSETCNGENTERIIPNKGETPRPLACRLNLSLRNVYGLAYCLPFNNIHVNNLFWHFHLHEKDKNTVLWHAQAYSFLQTLILICFLDNFKYVKLLNIFSHVLHEIRQVQS